MVDDSNGSCSVGLVSEEMSLFELSPSRFIFVGFSAGGSLAAFTALVAPWQIGRETAEMFKALRKTWCIALYSYHAIVVFFVGDSIAVQFRIYSYIAYKFDGDLVVY